MRAERVGECVWEIPPSEKPGMRVPARIYASETLFQQLDQGVFEQITNVACLPGIVGHALCMPDGHWGYGFPIGGVAAFDGRSGVISPGGIGFDINCGMRLIRTALDEGEVRPRLAELVEALFRAVPAGVGAQGFVKLDEDRFRDVMREGAGWCVRQGLGWREDLDRIEGRGCLPGADPAARATTISRSRRCIPRASTIARWRRPSAFASRDRSSSCCTAGRVASAIRSAPTTCAPSSR